MSMNLSDVERKRVEVDLGTECLSRALVCRRLGDMDKAKEWAEYATNHFITAGTLVDNC